MPLLGRSKPFSTRPRVLFPDPDGPTTARQPRSPISRSISRERRLRLGTRIVGTHAAERQGHSWAASSRTERTPGETGRPAVRRLERQILQRRQAQVPARQPFGLGEKGVWRTLEDDLATGEHDHPVGDRHLIHAMGDQDHAQAELVRKAGRRWPSDRAGSDRRAARLLRRAADGWGVRRSHWRSPDAAAPQRTAHAGWPAAGGQGRAAPGTPQRAPASSAESASRFSRPKATSFSTTVLTIWFWGFWKTIPTCWCMAQPRGRVAVGHTIDQRPCRHAAAAARPSAWRASTCRNRWRPGSHRPPHRLSPDRCLDGGLAAPTVTKAELADRNQCAVLAHPRTSRSTRARISRVTKRKAQLLIRP